MKKTLTSISFMLLIGMHLNAYADQQLSANQLKQLFPNSTQTGIARKTAEGIEKYWLYKRKDGTMIYKTEKGYSDEGKWWITDNNESCTQFKKLRNGKMRCSKIFKTGEKYKAQRPDGKIKEFILEAGNTKDLKQSGTDHN